MTYTQRERQGLHGSLDRSSHYKNTFILQAEQPCSGSCLSLPEVVEQGGREGGGEATDLDFLHREPVQ